MTTTSQWPGEKAGAAGVTARSAPAYSEGGGTRPLPFGFLQPQRWQPACVALQWLIG